MVDEGNMGIGSPMMRRSLRVALFAPSAPHFVATLNGLRQGFEALGCVAHAGWPLLDRRMLRAFCASFKPDIVFEVNRTGGQAFDGKPPCLHVAWIEAFRNEMRWIGDRLEGSDRLYFMLPPDLLGRPDMVGVEWQLLAPGADPEVFHPAATAPRWDLSLCGHLYAPLPRQVMDAPVMIRGTAMGTVGQLWQTAASWPMERHTLGYDAVVGNVVSHYRRLGADLGTADLTLETAFLIDEYIPRTASRTAIADAMLQLSAKVRFFGNAGWLLWPRFAPYYGGEITTPQELARLFRQTAINMHIALWPLHFRTIDCMAAGGLVFINQVEHPGKAAAFDAEFENGIHYVGYDGESFVETARRYLADPSARARIGAAAAARIAERHTWRHRAERILADLDIRP